MPTDDDDKLFGMRERFRDLLSEGPLAHLRAGEWVLQRLNNEDIPTMALLELVSFTLMSDLLRVSKPGVANHLCRATI